MAIQLFVKSLTGKTLIVNVNSTDTVLSVKQQLASEYGFALEQQRLLLADKQLLDSQTLSEVTTGSTAEVMLRLAGGGGTPTPFAFTLTSVTAGPSGSGQFDINITGLDATAIRTDTAIFQFYINGQSSGSPYTSMGYFQFATGTQTVYISNIANGFTFSAGQKFNLTIRDYSTNGLVTFPSNYVDTSTALTASNTDGTCAYSYVSTDANNLKFSFSSYGTGGVYTDAYLITLTDRNNSYTTTLNGLGSANAVFGTTISVLWSNFAGGLPSSLPYPGDGFTFTIANSTTGSGTGSAKSGIFYGTTSTPTISLLTSRSSTFYVTVVMPSTDNNITAVSVGFFNAAGVSLGASQTDSVGLNTGGASWPLGASATYRMQINLATSGYTFVDKTQYTFKATVTNAGGQSTASALSAAVAFDGTACFVATSRLLTPSGYKMAKDIENGDLLMTSDGRAVAVKCDTYTVQKTDEVTAPYLIAANAFREGYPKADLRLSGEHAIMFEPNVWMMPKWLATYSNFPIKQYDMGKSVTYYHFEAPHYFKDNFICEGAVVESLGKFDLGESKQSIWSYDGKKGGYIRTEPKKYKMIAKH